jgi:hypothetical protein
MRSIAGLTRILISLLILRVLAAPIAARPDTPKPPSNDRFIVRVCAWPAQRPQRLTSASILRPSFRGSGRDAKANVIPDSQAPPLRELSQSVLSRLAIMSDRDTTAFRIVDSPRC